MKFTKDHFIRFFLEPLSEFSENFRLNCGPEFTEILLATEDNSIVVYGRYDEPLVKIESEICIPDIKRFIRLLQYVKPNTNGQIELNHTNNNISLSSKELSFEYFLLDPAYLPKVPLNKDKINTLELDTTFNLEAENLQEVLKASSITINTEKVYFYSEDNRIVADLDDKERSSITNIKMQLSSQFSGSPIPSPIAFDLNHLRRLRFLKEEKIKMGFNHKLKIMGIETQAPQIFKKYIVPGLVK
jgi:hypothetical protein